MKNVLEIGACSMLDFPFDESNVNWIKLYHVNEPLYCTKSIPCDLFDVSDASDVDTVIISSGYKGIEADTIYHRLDNYQIFANNPKDSKIWDACVNVPVNILCEIAKNNIKSDKLIHVIYLDELTTMDDVIDPIHGDYVAAKSCAFQLIKNICAGTSNMVLTDVKIAPVKTRMNEFGMDPKVAFYELNRIIDTDTFDSMVNIKVINRGV